MKNQRIPDFYLKLYEDEGFLEVNFIPDEWEYPATAHEDLNIKNVLAPFLFTKASPSILDAVERTIFSHLVQLVDQGSLRLAANDKWYVV